MVSSLTAGLILIIIVVYCVVFPIVLASSQRPILEPLRLRKKLQSLSALASGLPMLSVIGWDSLGIPPSHESWSVNLLFVVAMAMPILAIPVIHFLFRGGPKGIVFVFLGFLFLVFTQIASPPLVTIFDIYSQRVSLVATPFEPHCDDQSIAPVFAHISDLHITDRKRTRDRKQRGNEKLKSILQAINLRKPPFLIVSGDITDEGTAQQWELVETLMQDVDSHTKILVSTGNHDLNYFFGSDPEEHPWTWFGLKPLSGIEAEPRIFRAAEFQARHLPDVLTNSGTSLRDVMSSVPTESTLERFQRQIAECAETCILQGDDPATTKTLIATCPSHCAHDLESVRFYYYHDLSISFPLRYLDEVSHTAFFSMTTSMADSSSVGRNAIGMSGEDQIRNLQAELKNLPASVKSIVLIQHHPLLWGGVPPFPHFQWSDFFRPLRTWDAFYSSPWFLAVFLHNDIEEGRQIYTILKNELAKRPGTSAVIVFGHRHERSLGRIGAMIFEEAPNLATTEPDDYGFYLVGTKANSLNVLWCRVNGK